MALWCFTYLAYFSVLGSSPSSATVALKRLDRSIPKSVFAHHIVGNTYGYNITDWASDISKAKHAGIDAFALNIGAQTAYNDVQLSNAYSAAEQQRFKLFLSFDYAAQGAWNISQVISTIKAYAGSSAQFKVKDLPFVSTFEGPGNAKDWTTIRQSVPVFFVPDWTSVGPDAFNSSYQQYTDGAFSWDAWPEGASGKTDESDKAWVSAVGSKSYVMPVSPWFYTNLPEYGKNWLWRGDDLWHSRWQQVLEIKPNFVEIITWNDYGESHYIGPIMDGGIPQGAHKYVDNMPHDQWRDLLPYYIAAYKNGHPPAVRREKVHFWYRLSPAAAGASDGTVGNAPYQPYTDPNTVVQDKVFFTALVKGPAVVTVQIGSNPPDTFHATSAGAYHSSTPFNGRTGAVAIKVARHGKTVCSAVGVAIVAAPANGKTNYNAWVGGSVPSI